MAAERDSQRSRYWKAVEAVRKSCGVTLGRLEGMDHARGLIKQWVKWKVVKAAGLRDAPELREGRCAWIGWNKDGYWLEVRSDGFTLDLAVALCFAIMRCSAAGEALHGWRSAKWLLYLTRRIDGEDAEKALRAAFKRERVRYKAPVKRTGMSASEKELLVRRLRSAKRTAEVAQTVDITAVTERRQSALFRLTMCWSFVYPALSLGESLYV